MRDGDEAHGIALDLGSFDLTTRFAAKRLQIVETKNDLGACRARDTDRVKALRNDAAASRREVARPDADAMQAKRANRGRRLQQNRTHVEGRRVYPPDDPGRRR